MAARPRLSLALPVRQLLAGGTVPVEGGLRVLVAGGTVGCGGSPVPRSLRAERFRSRVALRVPVGPAGLTRLASVHHIAAVSRPGGRSEPRLGEESPGSTEAWCRITSGGGDPRDSATESKPPRGSRTGAAR